MRFEDRHGQAIHTLNDWRDRGKPAADHHWKPGRSAYVLAADWIERDAQARVTALLRLRPELADGTLDKGIAEKKTRFDDNPRGPRNHDLLVHGTTNAGPLVLGVEGKADEPFDQPLSRWKAAALDRNIGSGAPERLDGLTTTMFGAKIDTDTSAPPLAGLGYQLLSAVAGTVADAKVAGASHAVLLVHEFRTELTDEKRHASNQVALEQFLTRLAGSDFERTGTHDAWITAPIDVGGDGTWRPATFPLHVAKLVTVLC
ncbi:MAG: hypothetical protein JWR63_1748 [Conexibacter sp.]|nr:hypothetical protein [Conexibacter sp.]